MNEEDRRRTEYYLRRYGYLKPGERVYGLAPAHTRYSEPENTVAGVAGRLSKHLEGVRSVGLALDPHGYRVYGADTIVFRRPKNSRR